MRQERLSRGAGVLLPIFSLPSDYGVGAMGTAAYGFIDFLAAAGQRYWQVLPMGPTIFGDSPYQSPSAFAGNPYFIDLNSLVRDGRLSHVPQNLVYSDDPSRVDYAHLYQTRHSILYQCFKESFDPQEKDFLAFCEQNSDWLDDYALFCSVKAENKEAMWTDFPPPLRNRESGALEEYRRAHEIPLQYHKYVQYLFFLQWARVRSYAKEHRISIIGDLPIYLGFDSADVWAHREWFELDENGYPLRVAGVPPDRFSENGQLWGNPLYRWERMQADGFTFFRRRAQSAAELYDILRIDHFIGLVNYYAIPAGESTAKNGTWNDVPYEALFTAMQDAASLRYIAEDLGVLNERTVCALRELGFPGMKVLSFAFDSGDTNEYLPHFHTPNSVVYGGTHDNEPLLSYFEHAPQSVRDFAAAYLQLQEKSPAVISEAVIRAGLGSPADLVIFSMQDYMGLGSEARINTPSVLGGNWTFRFSAGDFSEELARHMRELTIRYDR